MRDRRQRLGVVALALGGAAVCGLARATGGQPDLIADNRLALEYLRRAVAAHGSLAGDGLSLRLAVDCLDYRNATQARRAQPPVESHSWSRRYRIDRPAGRESVWTRNEIAGFIFEDTIVVAEGRALRFDHPTRRYEQVEGSGFSSFHLLPQRHVESALANKASAHGVRITAPGSAPTVAIDWVADGFARRMVVDEDSGLVRRVEAVLHADPYGDTSRTYLYEGRQSAAGLVLPASVTFESRDEVLGTVSNRFRLVLEAGAGDEPWAAPPGHLAAEWPERPRASLRRLADDLHLVENLTDSTGQWSYNVLFAERSDHILLTEAPLDNDTMEKLVERITAVAPGKPIRYLVQSHHHDDHLGGIRNAVARGVRIVTTPGNVTLLERIAAAPHTFRTDAQANAGRQPRLVVVRDGRLVLDDPRLEAQVFDVGPSSHAAEMLIVYFPSARLLYQADLVNAGEFPVTALGGRLVARVRELGLEVETLVGLHGRVVRGAELRALGF